jgi:hypothetical protein
MAKKVKTADDDEENLKFPGVSDRTDERDVAINPYREDGEYADMFADRVTLDIPTHKYFIKDDSGRVFFDYILSGSKLDKYAKLLLNEPEKASEYLTEQNKEKSVMIEAMASYTHRDLSDKPPYVSQSGWQRARDLGTLFHWYVERRIKGLPVEVPPEVYKEVCQFERFFQPLPANFFPLCEMSFGSLRHKICGTIDAAHFDGKEYTIWDWKNSGKIFDAGKIILDETRFVPGVNKRNEFSNHFYYTRDTRLSRVLVADMVFHPCVQSMTAGTFTKFIQMAAYRKLMILAGFPHSTKAVIGNVHADMFVLPEETEPELRIILLDLARPLAKFGGKSAIDIVQWIFDRNEEILKCLLT